MVMISYGDINIKLTRSVFSIPKQEAPPVVNTTIVQKTKYQISSICLIIFYLNMMMHENIAS